MVLSATAKKHLKNKPGEPMMMDPAVIIELVEHIDQLEEKQLEVSELKALLKSVVENRKDDDWMFEMASQIEDAIS